MNPNDAVISSELWFPEQHLQTNQAQQESSVSLCIISVFESCENMSPTITKNILRC